MLSYKKVCIAIFPLFFALMLSCQSKDGNESVTKSTELFSIKSPSITPALYLPAPTYPEGVIIKPVLLLDGVAHEVIPENAYYNAYMYRVKLEPGRKYSIAIAVYASKPEQFDGDVLLADTLPKEYMLDENQNRYIDDLPAFRFDYDEDSDGLKNWEEIQYGTHPYEVNTRLLQVISQENAYQAKVREFALGVIGTPDGGFVAVGDSLNLNNYWRDTMVWKYTGNGLLDSNFYNNGVFSYDTAVGTYHNGRAWGVSHTADGGWVVVGESYTDTLTDDMTVWKFDASGLLDTSFDGDGVLIYDLASADQSNEYARAVASTLDGGWVVVGNIQSVGSYSDVAVWKFTSAGILDPNFGNGGLFTRHYASGNAKAHGVSSTSDGGWVVVGETMNERLNTDMTVWKFSADGKLDIGFDGDGVFSYDRDLASNYNEVAYGVTSTVNGGWIVVGGSAPDMVVWKFNANGLLDSDFYANGVLTYRGAAGGGGTDIALSVSNTTDNGWVVAGYSSNLIGYFEMAVWKFTADGLLDTDFYGDGVFTHQINNNSNHYGYSVIGTADGGWVVVGRSEYLYSLYDYGNMVAWRFGR